MDDERTPMKASRFIREKLVRAQLKALDLDQVKSAGLRKRITAFRNKKGGFTLLELLVVVAILAAIASTATILLQDTDRRASAAAHVAIMDELHKGITTWRVLNEGKFPDVYDSLIQNSSNETTGGVLIKELDEGLADATDGFIEVGDLSEAEITRLRKVGITQLRVLNTAADGCADVGAHQARMRDKSNDIVNSNLFRAPGKRGGCGFTPNFTLPEGRGAKIAVWKHQQNYRINAQMEQAPVTASPPGATPMVAARPRVPAHRVVALGLGPDSDLFRADRLGALSTSPIYRHVDGVTYNRFIALINLDAPGEPQLQAVIDSSGDTREEELGEFDGTRSTL